MGNQPAESQVKVRNPWPKPVVPVERTTGLEPATLTLAKKKGDCPGPLRPTESSDVVLRPRIRPPSGAESVP